MKRRSVRRATRNSGAAAVEYALLLSLVAAVMIGSAFAFGAKVAVLFDRACDELASATSGPNC